MKRLFFTAPNLFFFYLYFFRTLTNPCIGNRQQSNQLHGLVILIIILLNIDIWLVVSNIFFNFTYIYIYGMSSQPHWLSLRHFSRWLVNHQPDIRYLPDVSMEKWGGNGIFVGRQWDTRPGKRLHSYGKSPSLMGKFTISTGPFSIAMSVSHYQRVSPRRWYGSLPETMVVLRDEHWADWANCHRLCGPDLCSGR